MEYFNFIVLFVLTIKVGQIAYNVSTTKKKRLNFEEFKRVHFGLIVSRYTAKVNGGETLEKSALMVYNEYLILRQSK